MCIQQILDTVWSWETLGFIAGLLVLAAFCMQDMVMLRIVALCSNLAFMRYGLAVDLTPVWVLHLLLLPMNGCRLLQALKTADSAVQEEGSSRKMPLMLAMNRSGQ
jgi:hypothetical protein